MQFAEKANEVQSYPAIFDQKLSLGNPLVTNMEPCNKIISPLVYDSTFETNYPPINFGPMNLNLVDEIFLQSN